MRSASAKIPLLEVICIFATCASLSFFVLRAAAQHPASKTAAAAHSSSPLAERFESPKQAADALIAAAEKFDVDSLTKIFGADGKDIVTTGEPAQDRQHAADFVAQAREKKSIS